MSISELQAFIEDKERLFVITGAGISAPSGIETYRDSRGAWQRPMPVQHQDFVASLATRRRYWARSLKGWPMFCAARPNAAHLSLSRLETQGRVRCVLTQNVDGLHQLAGQRSLIELHGSLAEVICLNCAARSSRSELQTWLETHNPHLLEVAAAPAPDGDAELESDALLADVRIPECSDCGGVLKPNVVFYGDSVPRSRVRQAYDALARADGVLVIGSSLMVYSSYRFCKAANEARLPMAALNQGRTRADEWFECKLEADCARVLPELVCSMDLKAN